jgi:hypothetical protein
MRRGVKQLENEPLDITNTLRNPLSPEQERLLELIWVPIGGNDTGDAPGWPVWDFVARRMYSDFPDLKSASEVFFSLPTIPGSHWSGKSYGLAWRDATGGALGIRPEERVGLTIAGFSALHATGSTAFDVASALVGILVRIARCEGDLVPDPRSVVSTTVSLPERIDWLARPSEEKPFAFPSDAVVSLIQQEFPRLQVYNLGIRLEGNWLRPLAAVSSVDDYLDFALTQGKAQVRYAATTSPLTLVQTLDYLSYVIVDLNIWDGRERIVNAPDLESAASLVATVQTRDEFESALIGLYNVVSKLRVPPIPAGEPERNPGTLNAMLYWFSKYVEDSEAQIRIQDAVGVLRAAVNLRHARAHSNHVTRARAIGDQAVLGLPALIVDWRSAWDLVRARMANAFDIIRRELQTASGDQA